jgi:hypothetical protein
VVRFTEVPTTLGKIADYSSRLSNVLGSIAGGQSAGGVLRYPSDMIDSSMDYMKISCLEYKPAGGLSANGSLQVQEGSAVSAANGKIKSTIILPMPQNIADSQAAGWNENSVDALSLAGFEAASGLINNDAKLTEPGKALKNAGGTIQGFTDKIGRSDGALIKQFQNRMAAQSVNALGGNVDTQSILSRTQGKIVNQNKESLFSGVSIRQFSYEFDLIPRSPKEGQTIKQILRTFKQCMSASKGGEGVFLNTPDVWKVEFMTGSQPHRFLKRHKVCALTQVGINYTAAGQYSTYEDATPTSMKLSLSFSELNPIYKEDYDTGEGLRGTGY